MKIYFLSGHKYPGHLRGVAAHTVQHYLVKGLGELGHEVFYHLKERPEGALPEGVTWCDRIPQEVDLLHINEGPEDYIPTGHPWVRIEHCYPRTRGLSLDLAMLNWIYVSKIHAELFGSQR